MQLRKKGMLTVLGAVTLIILVGLSYLNKSIFMEQILLCSFIIGLTTIVHLLGNMNNVEGDDERAKGKS